MGRKADEEAAQQRNRDRIDRGETPVGRIPASWPKGVSRKPIEADDLPDDDGNS